MGTILIYIENDGSDVKKSSLDAVAAAQKLSGDVVALSLPQVSDDALNALGNYGVGKIFKLSDASVTEESVDTLADQFSKLSAETGAEYILMGSSLSTEKISAKLSVKLKAGVLSNVIGMDAERKIFRRSVFTSKAFSEVKVSTGKVILTIKKGAFDLEEKGGNTSVEVRNATLHEMDTQLNVLETKKVEGDILLPEADLVVSAGRGLKGPENWGMIEELAAKLGAATACSKPVSDMGWRPHHEHVGQTGIKVSPNLYIAIGISGAIQHLAGVNSSKVIVAINTDEEAPFFKAADYGIVGDAFEVVPKLIQALS